MAEFPWFKMFSSDWIMETQFMTMEERGYYITLLCHQHRNGPILIDRIHFLGFKYEDIPDVVLSKFEKGQKGTLFNKKMNDVTSGYVEYIEKQKEYGKKGGRPKKQNKKGSQNHVNESESESEFFSSEEEGGTGGRSVKYPDKETFIKYAMQYYASMYQCSGEEIRLSASVKYDVWAGSDWMDGHGKKILNWKLKTQAVIPHLKREKRTGVPDAVKLSGDITKTQIR